MKTLIDKLRRHPFYEGDLVRSLRAKSFARRWTPKDEEHLRFYSAFIAPGDLVFDVGANIGGRTKVFLKLGARVVAVEPQEPCLRWIRSGFGRRRNLEIVPTALGEAEGEAEILVSQAHTISSLSKDWIETVRSSGRFSEFSWDRSQKVKIETLDHLIARFGRPAFVKIDVEGYEYSVLRGLTAPVRALSLELTPELLDVTFQCLRHLRSLGEISVNYTLGDDTSFALESWATADEACEKLEVYRDDVRVMGDVYVKFLGVGPS